MLKYIIGLLKYLLYRGVSIFAIVDNKSIISKKSKINRGAKIFKSQIGSYSYVGPYSKVVFSNIGHYCSISENCSIGLAFHSINNISTSPIFTSKKNATGYSWSNNNSFHEYKKVNIGNDVWIGTKVIIMGGVRIGHGAIIGAGSIVTKDIPDFAIAVGIPAKVIKYRFNPDIIEKLIEIKWWELPDWKLIENIKLFQNDKFDLKDLETLNMQNKI